MTESDLVELRGAADRAGLASEFSEMEFEIDRLKACLRKANDQAEHFEREWYLRGDGIDRLRAALRNLLYMDVAYMRGPKVEEAVEAARAALKETP